MIGIIQQKPNYIWWVSSMCMNSNLDNGTIQKLFVWILYHCRGEVNKITPYMFTLKKDLQILKYHVLWYCSIWIQIITYNKIIGVSRPFESVEVPRQLKDVLWTVKSKASLFAQEKWISPIVPTKITSKHSTTIFLMVGWIEVYKFIPHSWLKPILHLVIVILSNQVYKKLESLITSWQAIMYMNLIWTLHCNKKLKCLPQNTIPILESPLTRRGHQQYG